MYFNTIFMKKAAAALCLIVIVLFSRGVCSQENLYWSVLENDSRESYIDFSLKVDKSLNGKSIIFGKEMVEYSKNISMKNYMDLLVKYYSLARKNKSNLVKPLYFAGDGSLQRYEKDIVNIPDMYSSFNKLKRVEFGDVYFWGKYIAIKMKWYGDAGLLTNWVELVNCDKVCLLSDRLFHLDNNFSFFSVLLSLVKKPSQEDKINDRQWTQVMFDGVQEENPVLVRHKLQFLQDGKYIKRDEAESSQERGLVSKAVQYFKTIINTGSGSEDSIENAIAQVSNFVMDIWEFDIASKLASATDQAIYAKTVNSVGEIYEQYWDKNYTSNLIQNYSFSASESSSDSKKDINIGKYDGVRNYSNIALAQRVSNWRHLMPVAYAIDGKFVYVWFKSENIKNYAGFYIFSYDTSSGKLISPVSRGAWRFITNNMLSVSTVHYLTGNVSKESK